jgi:hypothetical protein
MTKKKQHTASSASDPEQTKLEILEAETRNLIERVQELEAENAQLRAKCDELRLSAARLAEAGSSVSIAPGATKRDAPAERTVIELGGTFYRVVRPRFYFESRLILATDLLVNEEIAHKLLQEVPQLFEELTPEA